MNARMWLATPGHRAEQEGLCSALGYETDLSGILADRIIKRSLFRDVKSHQKCLLVTELTERL